MDLGRPESAALLKALRPLGRRWHYLFVAMIAAACWGMAWLPGGYYVTMLSLLGILFFATWGSIRFFVRQSLLLRYPRMRYSGVSPYQLPWWVRIMLLVTLAAWLVNPAKITLKLTGFLFTERVRRAYEVEPFVNSTLRPGWYGPFYVDSVYIHPSGVHMRVFGGDEIVFDDQGLRIEMFRPWPFVQMSNRLGIYPDLYR